MIDMHHELIELYCEWAGLPLAGAGLLSNWEAVPLWRGGEIIGIAILMGTEIHFALAPEHRHRGIQRWRAREFLQPLLQRRGFLTTRVWADKFDRWQFLVRLGFEHTWSEGEIDHYMLSELPFGKEN